MAEQRFVKYGDRELALDDGITLEQAKELMARHFPELAGNPKVDTKKQGNKTIYVFSKSAGHKGARRNVYARLAARILQIQGLDSILPIEDPVELVDPDPDQFSPSEGQGLATELREDAERTHRVGDAVLDVPSALDPRGSIL